MASEAWRGPRTGGLGWLAWVALAVVWFATTQVRPMFDPDEGRYAEIPREMVASGDWITPRLNDLKYFEKPPLQYWATAVVYSVLGLTEWTSRLWTVGLAFACLPMVFAWTSRLYGRNAAIASLVALAVSPYFVVVGHLNLLDAGFTLWLSGAMFAFTLAQSSEVGSADERRWMLIAWAAAALAVLSKGIVVGVLAGATLVIYTLIERDVRPWKRLHLLPGLSLFLLIAAPWFIAVTLRNPDFPGFFFVHEHFARFLTTVHQRVEPWWFFLPILLLGVLPWILSFYPAVRAAWLDAEPAVSAALATNPASTNPAFKPRKFLLIFAAVTLLFFSASGSKLAPYILPMMPPLAAIAGAYVAERPEFLRRVAMIGAGTIALVGILLLIVVTRRYGPVPHEGILWTVVAIVIGLAGVLNTLRAPQGVGNVRLAFTTAAAAVLAWQCLLCAFGVVLPSRSGRDLALSAQAHIHPQTELFSVGQFRETLPPYLRRAMTLVEFEGELQFGLNAEPGKQRATPEEFMARWGASTDAVAFFEPDQWEKYRRRGLPGRVIAQDHYTVAVSRL